ncbi:DUF4124 domain-containing protein [Alloalcanivorax sp. C16-1]|uniref:DUF4124 domain-containing protein n=1 Tax=Alloalcanivorax sp. C16-1 TaxID=3390051 RepID=UPI0039709C22
MSTRQILAAVSMLMVAVAAPARTVDADVDRPGEGGGAIYRTVDENGNVLFTDNPPDKGRAEPVQVGPVNTMEGRREALPVLAPDQPEPREDTTEPAPADAGYRALRITTPADGATVRMPQDNPVAVQASAEPALLNGHRLVILDNGQPVDGGALDFPNPGPHRLQAVIEDENGRRLITSSPVTLHVHRTNIDSSGKAGGGSAFPTRAGSAQRGDAAGRAGAARSGGAAQRGSGAALGSGAQRVTRPAKP